MAEFQSVIFCDFIILCAPNRDEQENDHTVKGLGIGLADIHGLLTSMIPK